MFPVVTCSFFHQLLVPGLQVAKKYNRLRERRRTGNRLGRVSPSFFFDHRVLTSIGCGVQVQAFDGNRGEGQMLLLFVSLSAKPRGISQRPWLKGSDEGRIGYFSLANGCDSSNCQPYYPSPAIFTLCTPGHTSGKICLKLTTACP